MHTKRRLTRIDVDRIKASSAGFKLPSDPETIHHVLEEYDRTERPYRTEWRCEILRTFITLPTVMVTPWQREYVLTLDEEIRRRWNEAGWAYTYGLFQAATLLICVFVELELERYLRARNLWSDYEELYKEHQRTFGSLIQFCRGSKKRGRHTTKSFLEKCDDLNQIRIEAAHMNIRRSATLKVPPNMDSENDMDEIQNITVEKNGKKSGIAYILDLDDLGYLHDDKTHEFYRVRAFGHYARKALGLASEIANLLY